MAAEPPVLDLDRVTGGYGGADVIREVSITLGRAEIVVLIGPNGAGKSSVMNAVLGTLVIGGGRIRLHGDNITGTSPERVVRRGVSYVPQTGNVFPNLTVNENLEMGAYIRTDDFRPRMDEMYALFPPLAERRRAPAGALSGGQRQMVAIAKALMVEPTVLLLDEPTAGLSPRFRGEIFAVVEGINARGTPILMVEQNARQALGIADRGYVLVDGRNRMDGTGAGLLADPDVGAMFLGGSAEPPSGPGGSPGGGPEPGPASEPAHGPASGPTSGPGRGDTPSGAAPASPARAPPASGTPRT